MKLSCNSLDFLSLSFQDLVHHRYRRIYKRWLQYLQRQPLNIFFFHPEDFKFTASAFKSFYSFSLLFSIHGKRRTLKYFKDENSPSRLFWLIFRPKSLNKPKQKVAEVIFTVQNPLRWIIKDPLSIQLVSRLHDRFEATKKTPYP